MLMQHRLLHDALQREEVSQRSWRNFEDLGQDYSDEDEGEESRDGDTVPG